MLEVAQRGGGNSDLGDFQNSAWQDSEKPGITLKLALL